MVVGARPGLQFWCDIRESGNVSYEMSVAALNHARNLSRLRWAMAISMASVMRVRIA